MEFKLFFEGKETNEIKALVDIAEALKKVFDKYSLDVRKDAWHKIISEKGKKEVDKLLRTPTRSTSPFRNL